MYYMHEPCFLIWANLPCILFGVQSLELNCTTRIQLACQQPDCHGMITYGLIKIWQSVCLHLKHSRIRKRWDHPLSCSGHLWFCVFSSHDNFFQADAIQEIKLDHWSRPEFVIWLLTFIHVSTSIHISVDGGHRAVIFDRFRGVQQEIVGEGTHFLIPWVQRPIVFDIRAKPRNIPVATGSKGKNTWHHQLTS